MNTEIPTTTPEHKPSPATFGARLKSAREALGLERKEAATQLRLPEKVIMMMEKDRYAQDLPITFVRGYLRAYGKLLQIPEYEVKKALEHVKPIKTAVQSSPPPLKSTILENEHHYLMKLLTYLILLTLTAFVGAWWYTQRSTAGHEQDIALNAPSTEPAPQVLSAAMQPPETLKTETISPNLAAMQIKEQDKALVQLEKKETAPFVPPYLKKPDVNAAKNSIVIPKENKLASAKRDANPLPNVERQSIMNGEEQNDED